MAADGILDNGARISEYTAATGGRSAVSRRDFLIQGSSATALLAPMEAPLWAQIQDASEAEKVVPFVDQPPAPPEAVIQQLGELNQLNWQQLMSWITPNGGFFNVSHYNRPVIRPEDWRVV
jgi:hypothetical protein